MLNPLDKYQCPDCEVSFRLKYNFDEHLIKNHLSKRKPNKKEILPIEINLPLESVYSLPLLPLSIQNDDEKENQEQEKQTGKEN